MKRASGRSPIIARRMRPRKTRPYCPAAQAHAPTSPLMVLTAVISPKVISHTNTGARTNRARCSTRPNSTNTMNTNWMCRPGKSRSSTLTINPVRAYAARHSPCCSQDYSSGDGIELHLRVRADSHPRDRHAVPAHAEEISRRDDNHEFRDLEFDNATFRLVLLPHPRTGMAGADSDFGNVRFHLRGGVLQDSVR